MKKVLLISNIPVDYRVDLFNLLANDKNFDFNFLFIENKPSELKKIIYAKQNNYFLSKSIFYQKRTITNLFNLFKLIIRIKPDIIIFGGIPNYSIILFILKFFLRFKLVCWWAGHIDSESKNFKKNIFRKLIALKIDSAIFYSKLSYSYFESEIKNLKNKYTIIGNNTRIIELDKLPKRELHNSNIIKIITIGFQSNKNTEFLIHTLNETNIENYNICLTVIGDGPDLINLKSIKSNFKIEYLGNLKPENVFYQLSKHNIFIHPSFYDRWPQVINEASYVGIPLLISNKAGFSNDYTQKYRYEALFDPFDKNDLSYKLKNLILNPNLLKEMGEFAQKCVLENDGEIVYKKIINLIDEK